VAIEKDGKHSKPTNPAAPKDLGTFKLADCLRLGISRQSGRMEAADGMRRRSDNPQGGRDGAIVWECSRVLVAAIQQTAGLNIELR